MKGYTRIRRLMLLLPLLAALALFLSACAAVAPGSGEDPSGLETGKDGTALVGVAPANLQQSDFDNAASSEPLAVKLAAAVNQNRLAVNFVWTLVTGYLVMFMQVGFALVETGFTRAKNAAHTMTMNFLIYVLGMAGFYICGFAFMFGGVGLVGVPNLGGLSILNSASSVWAAGASSAPRASSCPAAMTSPSPCCSCSRWSSWTPRPPSPPAPWPSAGIGNRSASTACSSAASSTPSTACGPGVAAGCRSWANRPGRRLRRLRRVGRGACHRRLDGPGGRHRAGAAPGQIQQGRHGQRHPGA